MSAVIMPAATMKVLLEERAHMVEAWLAICLQNPSIPSSLQEAMEYSLMAGGKRLRPVLCLTTALLAGHRAGEDIMPFAAAIEMIHTYSLIHDDLPAMDNDDIRRGKPSNHKVFGEARAILAGDALLTDAFAFMTTCAAPAERVVRAVRILAQAAGSSGMVGGQTLDMEYTGRGHCDVPSLRAMHAMKTGALIIASCQCGAILGGAEDAQINALGCYGAALGVAFQITDDILDVTSDTHTLGKPAGSDVAQGKLTYPALVGLQESKHYASAARDVALAAVVHMEGPEAAFLRGIADYVVARAC